MNLSTIWLILTARKRLFFAVLGGVVLIVLAVCLIMPETYISGTSLVIDTKTTDPVTGTPGPPGDVSATVLATQLDIILSHNVALKVVDKLNLTSDPYYIRKFGDATAGKTGFRDWIAYRIADSVVASPSSKDSNVINIEYPAEKPGSAAQMANAYAEAYIQTSLELREDPARRQAGWFDQQTLGLRQRVDAAQQRLLDAQLKSSIVGTEDHIDVDNAKLTEVSTQLVTAQQVLYDSRNRLKQMNDALAKGKLEALPDILNNELLQTLKTDLARAESNFAEVSARFDHNHPQYLSAEATVKSLRSKLAKEVEAVRGSIEQQAQISQRQVDELQQALDQQKQTVLGAKREHDALGVLNRELQSAQTAFDAGMQRASQVRLASELNQSSIAMLNIAVPPTKPSRPKPLLYMVLGLTFGTLLAAGISLVVELGDRRVRSRSDVSDFAGLLVLSVVPRLRAVGPPRLRGGFKST
jgi:polysaccharide biosynthesis transport protein